MKVLITGGNGQLGWELQRTVPEGVEVRYRIWAAGTELKTIEKG